jgi:chaperone required for assembly of F1-ATPase
LEWGDGLFAFGQIGHFMRDILEDLFVNEPLDPVEAARRNMRPNLRKRFYTAARAGEGPPHPILLDGRPVKTPAGGALSAPVSPLGEAIAAEWDAQGERIDPATMPLTRFANTVIDSVAANPAPVIAEIAKYLGSDLVCYRAGTPDGLVAKQAKHWDPMLAWARDALGARFVLSEGVVFVAQPDAAIAAARGAIPEDPWRLGAASVVTTLTGSALIALALAAGRLTLEAAWDAANVDEDWNMEFWGRDELALQRRAARLAEMQAAASVLRLTA